MGDSGGVEVSQAGEDPLGVSSDGGLVERSAALDLLREGAAGDMLHGQVEEDLAAALGSDGGAEGGDQVGAAERGEHRVLSLQGGGPGELRRLEGEGLLRSAGGGGGGGGGGEVDRCGGALSYDRTAQPPTAAGGHGWRDQRFGDDGRRERVTRVNLPGKAGGKGEELTVHEV